ncbi:hypothetical protein L9F63_009847, partial [Diploptera punctata]
AAIFSEKPSNVHLCQQVLLTQMQHEPTTPKKIESAILSPVIKMFTWSSRKWAIDVIRGQVKRMARIRFRPQLRRAKTSEYAKLSNNQRNKFISFVFYLKRIEH